MRPSEQLLLIVVAPIILFAIVCPSTAQPYYYETVYVGQVPPQSANEAVVLSVWESPSALSGIFADYFSSAGQPATTIHSAALDGNIGWAVGSPLYYPTGALCVAKNVGGYNGIETYAGINESPGSTWWLTQELQSTPPPVSYLTLSASLNRVQAMDMANGWLPSTLYAPPTNYFVTAETLLNQLWIGAYALTDAAGNPVQPYLANATNTFLSRSCYGLTTSNSKAGPLGPLHRNDIVFVDSSMEVHAISFDITNWSFGGLDDTTVVSFAVPWNLSQYGSTIAGIWATRNAATYSSLQYISTVSHDIGISIPNPSLPTSAPGTFCILRDAVTPPLPSPTPNIAIARFGGGPLSHVPVGDLRGNPSPNPAASPSQQLFGWNWGPGGRGDRPGPFGWYVITPGGFFQITVLDAVDTNGVRRWGFAVAQLPANAIATGSPLAHSGYMGLSGNPNLCAGLVWIPYRTAVGVEQLDMTDGVGARQWGTVGLQNVAGANHFPLQNQIPPQLLPLAGQPWGGGPLIPDLKTNWKSDHCMGALGQ